MIVTGADTALWREIIMVTAWVKVLCWSHFSHLVSNCLSQTQFLPPQTERRRDAISPEPCHKLLYLSVAKETISGLSDLLFGLYRDKQTNYFKIIDWRLIHLSTFCLKLKCTQSLWLLLHHRSSDKVAVLAVSGERSPKRPGAHPLWWLNIQCFFFFFFFSFFCCIWLG